MSELNARALRDDDNTPPRQPAGRVHPQPSGLAAFLVEIDPVVLMLTNLNLSRQVIQLRRACVAQAQMTAKAEEEIRNLRARLGGR